MKQLDIKYTLGKYFKNVQKMKVVKGRPTKLTISLPDYVIRRIPPLWEKYQQTWNMYNWGLFRFIYFFKKNAPPQEMNPQFGNTLICGSLFNGTYVDRSTQFFNPMNYYDALCKCRNVNKIYTQCLSTYVDMCGIYTQYICCLLTVRLHEFI